MTVHRSARLRSRAAGLLAAATAVGALAGCGADDTTARATAAKHDDASGTTVSTAAGSPGAATGRCPDAADVGAAIGVDVAVDESSPVETDGFCPYAAVASPDSLTVSITFTAMDVTRTPGGEPVDGVGQAARWEPVTDELSVWTGDEGLIVMVSPFGVDIDSRQAAIDLADLVLRSG